MNRRRFLTAIIVACGAVVANVRKAPRRIVQAFVVDEPQVGSLFTADKVTYKIRYVYGETVFDYRPLHDTTETTP